MKRGTTCQKLFSIEEASREMQKYEQRSEAMQGRTDCGQRDISERYDTMHGPNLVVTNSKVDQKRPHRIAYNLSKLACISPRLSTLHNRAEDDSCPENGDNSGQAASMTPKSSDPSEDVPFRPLFMRRPWSSANSIVDDVVGVRGANQSDKWYVARNEEPDHHDGVMHAVFFDTRINQRDDLAGAHH